MSLENAGDGNCAAFLLNMFQCLIHPWCNYFFTYVHLDFTLLQIVTVSSCPFTVHLQEGSVSMFVSCCGDLEADVLHDHFAFCCFLLTMLIAIVVVLPFSFPLVSFSW